MRARNPSLSLPVVATPSTTIAPAQDQGNRPAISWLRRRWNIKPEYQWIILSGFFMAVIIGVSIGVGWAFKLHPLNLADSQAVEGNVVSLTTTLIAIDPVGQTMTMDWFATYPCDFNTNPSNCPDINIFFDEWVEISSPSSGGPVPSNTLPSPTFFLNTTDYFLGFKNESDGRFSTPIFRTILAITSAGTGRTLQSYPFDKYFSQISIFAQNAADNSSIGVAIPATDGLATGFNAILQGSLSGVEDNFGTLLKTIVVTRGQVVRVYSLLVVMAVWFITLIFIGACIVSVFFGKGMSASVLVLPPATLFAFTQLRGTLPGAPAGFGATVFLSNFVGILPCLALLTFCSVFMTAIFLFRNPERDSPHWEKISANYSIFQARGHTSGA
ncbi:hypothetical protein B0H21DRAFT_688195 [Amylocystis lapponica]|nr:hypothetical protein B0H21DRAFT_688195 [Amylocystis lapponica]